MNDDGPKLDRRQIWRLRFLLSGLAVLSVFLALFAAVFVGGPIARTLFGTPPGFRDHFVSNRGLVQATLVQGLIISVVYVIQGFVQARRNMPLYQQAILTANPLVVALAFVAYKLTYEALPLRSHDIEFYSAKTAFWLVIVGAGIFAGCYLAGAHIGFMRTRADRHNSS